jgi:hypothetical protein
MLLVLFFVAASSLPISAKVHILLDEEACAKSATHIVVATEGNDIDGQLQVIESWKGDLRPDDTLTIPEFASFKSLESQTVKCNSDFQLCVNGAPEERVTCSRMILFLRKDLRQGKWNGIGELIVVQTTIWIEGKRSFALQDASKDERGTLARFGLTEQQIKARVIAVLQTKDG